ANLPRAAALLLLAMCAGAWPAVADTPAVPGTRTLLLVRHGDYDSKDPRDEAIGKGLTPLGRDQSEAVARRLAAWPQRVTRVRASTLTRARETATIVGRTLHLAPELDPDLAECTPPTP